VRLGMSEWRLNLLSFSVLSPPSDNPANGAAATIKRLLEAENRAADILSAAKVRAQDSLSRARQEAAHIVSQAREEATQAAQKRIKDAESEYQAEIRHRVDQATLKAQEFEQKANALLQEAVDAVVDWVTGQKR